MIEIITVPVDDAGPTLAPVAQAIVPWTDRLITAGLDPRPLVPQQLNIPVADPRYLQQPAAAAALAEAYAHVLRYERRHAPDAGQDAEH